MKKEKRREIFKIVKEVERFGEVEILDENSLKISQKVIKLNDNNFINVDFDATISHFLGLDELHFDFIFTIQDILYNINLSRIDRRLNR